MDQRLREKLTALREMGSELAANWLLANCPVNSDSVGDAFLIIPKLSWKKSDQVRLAQHYLSKIPYANSKPYEAFASIMPVEKLVSIIEGFLPMTAADRNLLLYHLGPVLRKANDLTGGGPSVDLLLANLTNELEVRGQVRKPLNYCRLAM